MQDLIGKYRSNNLDKITKEDKEYFGKIEKYLLNQNLADSNYARLISPIKYIANILSEELIKVQTDPAQNIGCIINVVNRLFSIEYEDAKRALISFIIRHSGLYLVMIDSIESYDIRDKILNAITSSLIETAQQFYLDLDKDRILVKVAFPSEIYNQLIPQNREKMIGRVLMIHCCVA